MMSDGTMTSAAQKSKNPAVHIVVLNWNGWADTIECLESVFQSDYPNFKVIVCDNGSADESLAIIKAWANGNLDVEHFPEQVLRFLSYPPVAKPIPFLEYDRVSAEAAGSRSDGDFALILIQNGENLGFAGGCNVGLRYALARDDFDYVWLLNNDSVVQPDALRQLVERMERAPHAGMCGSRILDYAKPDTIQRLAGASYNKWFGVSSAIGLGRPFDAPLSAAIVESQLSYVSGASMLVRKSFLKVVGLMAEEYFLYFEELDWMERARGLFDLAYAPDSVVFHKEGASIGSHKEHRKVSVAAEYYLKRNRIKFTRRYYPYCLPTIYLALLLAALDRIRIGRWDLAIIIGRAMFCLGRGTPSEPIGHDKFKSKVAT